MQKKVVKIMINFPNMFEKNTFNKYRLYSRSGHPNLYCPISLPACAVGRWGRNCQNECRCMNGGTCEPLTGACACAAGWRGDACERACAPPSFGDDCAQICQCQNNATCDPASGACACAPGFTGPL